MKKRIALVLSWCLLLLFLLGGISIYAACLPSRYQITAEEGLSFSSPYWTAKPARRTLAVNSSTQETRRYTLYFGGILPVKTVSATVCERPMLIPSGEAFGVKMFTSEPAVVGIERLSTEQGSISPGKEAGVQIGDRILSINGQAVATNEDVAAITQTYTDKPLLFRISRDGAVQELLLTPVWNEEHQRYQTGLWIRDSAAGIGTITYWNPKTNTFAGLGHGICDSDTGNLMTVGSGEICPVTIFSVRKGSGGNPGELFGNFSSDETIGNLRVNNDAGIQGDWYLPLETQNAIPMAFQQEVHTGDAEIRCTVDENGPQSYRVKLLSVNYDPKQKTKNLVLQITDPVLLEKTGGIVQGLSGSPILQDGKLVGAVTHVFLNDSTKGYGIFAENMLGAAA